MDRWRLVIRYAGGVETTHRGRGAEHLKGVAREIFRHGSAGDPIAVIINPGGDSALICRLMECGYHRLRWLWIPGEPGEEWEREWKRRGEARA